MELGKSRLAQLEKLARVLTLIRLIMCSLISVFVVHISRDMAQVMQDLNVSSA